MKTKEMSHRENKLVEIGFRKEHLLVYHTVSEEKKNNKIIIGIEELTKMSNPEFENFVMEKSFEIKSDKCIRDSEREKEIKEKFNAERIPEKNQDKTRNVKKWDVEHRRRINKRMLLDLLELGINKVQAMSVIKAVFDKKIKGMELNYDVKL